MAGAEGLEKVGWGGAIFWSRWLPALLDRFQPHCQDVESESWALIGKKNRLKMSSELSLLLGAG